jgi:hypothetical protein
MLGRSGWPIWAVTSCFSSSLEFWRHQAGAKRRSDGRKQAYGSKQAQPLPVPEKSRDACGSVQESDQRAAAAVGPHVACGNLETSCIPRMAAFQDPDKQNATFSGLPYQENTSQ